MKYFDKLKMANNATKSLGLDGVDLKTPIDSCFLSDSFFGRLGNYIKIDQPEELVLKCNVVSQIIVEEINKNMDCRAYLTIGDVTLGGASQFDYDAAYLIALANGEKGSLIPSEYKHHA